MLQVQIEGLCLSLQVAWLTPLPLPLPTDWFTFVDVDGTFPPHTPVPGTTRSPFYCRICEID